MVDWLTELLKEVWQTKQIPQEWKDGTLMPLHKKKDSRICDKLSRDYRYLVYLGKYWL